MTNLYLSKIYYYKKRKKYFRSTKYYYQYIKLVVSCYHLCKYDQWLFIPKILCIPNDDLFQNYHECLKVIYSKNIIYALMLFILKILCRLNIIHSKKSMYTQWLFIPKILYICLMIIYFRDTLYVIWLFLF